MVTLEDVAKKANVSVMTVSRIINKPETVKESTRVRIQKIIEELDYKPNFLAKSLVNGNSRTIGILYSNIYNQAYLDMIVGIDEVAYTKNYCIISSNVDNYKNAKKTLNMLIGNRVDGLIILPMEMAMSTRKDFNISISEMGEFYKYLESTIDRHGIPCVTVGEKVGTTTNIAFDFEKLAVIAMDYLLDHAENITMINSIIQDGLWMEKEKVYIDKMKKRGLEKYIRIVRDSNSVQGGYNAMNEICKSENLPEAIFCANDYFAIGAVQAAWSNGIRVPEDISIIGNDDVQFSKMTFPQITTVSLNALEAGKNAMKTLLNLIVGKPSDDKIMNHHLVIRDSVKK